MSRDLWQNTLWAAFQKKWRELLQTMWGDFQNCKWHHGLSVSYIRHRGLLQTVWQGNRSFHSVPTDLYLTEWSQPFLYQGHLRPLAWAQCLGSFSVLSRRAWCEAGSFFLGSNLIFMYKKFTKFFEIWGNSAKICFLFWFCKNNFHIILLNLFNFAKSFSTARSSP